MKFKAPVLQNILKIISYKCFKIYIFKYEGDTPLFGTQYSGGI